MVSLNAYMTKDFHPGHGCRWRRTNREHIHCPRSRRVIEDTSCDDGEQRRAMRNGRERARAIRAWVSLRHVSFISDVTVGSLPHAVAVIKHPTPSVANNVGRAAMKMPYVDALVAIKVTRGIGATGRHAY